MAIPSKDYGLSICSAQLQMVLKQNKKSFELILEQVGISKKADSGAQKRFKL